MLWKSWNDPAVVVVVVVVVSLSVLLRDLLIPHQSLTWAAGCPRAFSTSRLHWSALRTARQAMTRLRLAGHSLGST
jgi:hypothetical protein